MPILLLALILLTAALMTASVVKHKGREWIPTVALVLLVIAGLVAALSSSHQVGVMCDPMHMGGVRNQSVLCQPGGDDKYRCYLPNANCERTSVDVEVVDESAIDWEFGDDDMYVKTRDKTFLVSAALPRGGDDNTFVGARDLPGAQPAYDVLPWPVVRAVVGSILGGG